LIRREEHITDHIQRRREVVFLLLAGIFLGSLALLNVLGISRFIDLSHWLGISTNSPIRFSLGVGVLAYPITFLCTDFISEIYGRKRANNLVWMGLILNIWVFFMLWLGGALNPPESLGLDGLLPMSVVNGEANVPHGYSFYQIRFFAFGGIFASMVAYLVAQFCDVQIFHYIKKRTGKKKLWLRNNASTLVSQLVDSVSVILITHFYAHGLPLREDSSLFQQLMAFILSSYLFKVLCALFDTIPFYFGTIRLRSYLQIEDEIPY
jgi:uncharacterized PurR-regulated membrane protein YhhQ (DUF165 family)